MTTPRRPSHGARYTPEEIRELVDQLPNDPFDRRTLVLTVERSPLTQGRGPAEMVSNSVRHYLLRHGYVRELKLGYRHVLLQKVIA